VTKFEEIFDIWATFIKIKCKIIVEKISSQKLGYFLLKQFIILSLE